MHSKNNSWVQRIILNAHINNLYWIEFTNSADYMIEEQRGWHPSLNNWCRSLLWASSMWALCQRSNNLQSLHIWCQTDVSELRRRTNLFDLGSTTSSVILKWGNARIWHRSETSFWRNWNVIPWLIGRDSNSSHIRAQVCTGFCSFSFWKKLTHYKGSV